jgi:hypothetical protein
MSTAKTQRRVADPAGRLRTIRLGGAEGNDILTSAIAIVLTALLALEGVTVVDIAGLLSAHMFIGLVLLPPVTLKLASTGYRAFRYYTHSRAYRAQGPPRLLLRLLAPVLVASTIAIFVTGVMLLALGHKAGTVLEIHKLAFIVFGVLLVTHLVAYAPRVLRSLRRDWSRPRREQVPGSSLRAMLVALTVGGGAALAISLLHAINTWRS